MLREAELLDEALAAAPLDERSPLRDRLLELHRQLGELELGMIGDMSPSAQDEAIPTDPPSNEADDPLLESVAPAMGAYQDPWADTYQLRWWNGHKWSIRAKGMRGPRLADRNRTLRPPAGRALTEGEKEALTEQQRAVVRPTATLPNEPTSRLRVNRAAVAGFTLGLASIALYDIGIIPILAVAFSWVALATYRAGSQSGRWMAIVGLIVGAIYTVAYLLAYGHIGT